MLPTHTVSLSSLHALRNVRAGNDVNGDSDDEDTSGLLFLNQSMMHIQLLMLDYKQFKAARLIQRQVRGFLVRLRIRRWDRAARIVGAAWRRFIAKRNLMTLAELRLQFVVRANFETASIRIQAYYRGFWSRRYISNMVLLKNIQKEYVEEILKVCAQRLHSMMNKGELPGYLNFCADPDYCKMRDLLNMLTYRFYNRSVYCRHLMTTGMMHRHRREFSDSAFYTRVPYAGFNDKGKCYTRSPIHGKGPKDYGMREYDLAQTFVRHELGPIIKKKEKLCSKKRVLNEKHFCDDLIHSIKFWHDCSVFDDLTEENMREYLEPKCGSKRDKRH